MGKRVSCRAIIFDNDNNLLTMYREKRGSIYYSFAGGGVEKGESLENCVIREVKEEFGISVEVIKLVYVIESLDALQYFYLCKWVAGEFGTGDGEEYQENYKYGLYLPKLVSISNLRNIDLKPPEITASLIRDIELYGKELNSQVLNIQVDYNNMGWIEYNKEA